MTKHYLLVTLTFETFTDFDLREKSCVVLVVLNGEVLMTSIATTSAGLTNIVCQQGKIY